MQSVKHVKMKEETEYTMEKPVGIFTQEVENITRTLKIDQSVVGC